MDRALKSMQLPDTTVFKIISSMQKKINLRKCHIGDKLYLTQRESELIELTYEGQKETWILDSLFQVSRLQTKSKYVHLQGDIEKGVLWDGIIKAGGTPYLVYEFADEVFAWDIDFNVETRKGDEFEIFTTAEYSGDRFIGYGKILFARYISGKKEFTGVYYTKSTTGYYNLAGKSLRKLFLRSPVSYIRISSRFTKARFHPILRRWMPHLGIDYAAPTGTPVRTIGDGTVTFAGWRKGFGKSVIIKHAQGFTSYYGHLSRITRGTRKGKRVKQGKIIGKVGSTGLSTGPHLDFRLKKYKRWVNPIKLIPPPIKPLRGKELADYKRYTSDLLLLVDAIDTVNKMLIVAY